MTDSERQQILKMIAEGKISAEEGLNLMRALEESALHDEIYSHDAPSQDWSAAAVAETESEKARRQLVFAQKVEKMRRLWMFPLAFGVFVTIGAAYWMFSTLESAGMNAWFFCAWLPLGIGVAVIALALSSRNSRWLYVDIKQKTGKRPSRLVISFPINLVTWLIGLLGGQIPARERERVDMVRNAFEQSVSSSEPILVEVNESDEQVLVYIG
ncbi:MAG: hypothetical protein DDG60_15355 [Anaerolineae bacterium]|nr:MAG: hypothetical protein DDG60_15355 [Anaerolineae bacterium]